ncbi:MAG: FlgD immunoglobulin-like domain containing protein, partial [Trebonia sp.]
MIRWPLAGFVALAAATVGAFFVVQHLKVATPLINGFPAPVPSTIDPLHGGHCPIRNSKGVVKLRSFKRTSVSFYLQGRADDVDVFVLNADRTPVRQIGFDVHMRVKHRHAFWWDGRLADGSIAPDGRYYIKAALVHQGRSFLISNPSTGTAKAITVLAHPPRLRVTGITPRALVGPTPGTVTIHYAGAEQLRPKVLIYRIRPGRRPERVKRYSATSRAGTSIWDGRIKGIPAPDGTYLVTLSLTNQACTTLH